MTKKQAERRIEKLKKLISHHRYLYHVLDKQEISDAALDSLKKELFDLEQEYPEFITPDSPTQRIAGKPLEKFKKIRHPEPMLSINDAFSEKDVQDWLERNKKLLTKEETEKIRTRSLRSQNLDSSLRSEIDFFCELKIDGLAIELIYENQILKTGSTRGDGRVGEDVTQNLKTIEAIPLRLRNLPTTHYKLPTTIVVRGEVFISKKEFEKLNKARKKKGLSLYANPRNVAAGSIRQLDPKVTASRHLNFFSYELKTDLGEQTHEQKHQILKILGFKTIKENRYARNLEAAFKFHDLWQKKREALAYEIDGIVITINSNEIFEKLGVVGKSPRGIVAYKFPLKQATTTIKDIKVQVGRTGALTPVAILKPIEVGGVTISRATLHNEDEIKRLGVKIGDTVIVGRAGDVIPDIIKALPELRTGQEKKFSMPKICPVCGAKIVKPGEEVLSFCPDPQCSARHKRLFYHFVSRPAFDISGLGPKIIDQLISEGLVSDPADLFELEEGDLVPQERFAEKSAENLIKAIQSSRKVSLPRFIYALGIRNVGEETAQDLAEHFGNFEALKKANLEELEALYDIGPIVAKSINAWFQEKRNQNFLERLKKTGVKILEKRKVKDLPLKGKNFVLTGTLKSLTRDEAKEKLRTLGGTVSDTISDETDFLILGENPGSKYQKAKKLGIKILKEKQFLKMIK